MILTSNILNSLQKWDGVSRDFKAKIISRPENYYRIAGYRDYHDVFHVIVYDDSDGFETESRRGMSVEYREIDVIDEGVKGVFDFSCNSIGFKHNFITIFNDVLKAAETSKNLKKSTKQVIEKWFYFLQLPRKEELNFAQILGLTGELLSLENFMQLTQNMSLCLDSWVGPLKARRDFIFKKIEIEVKTSAKQQGHVHKINGIDQLEQTEEKNIFLYSWNILRDYSENAYSINNVISRIVNIMENEGSLNENFFDKLYESGYDIRDKNIYDNIRLRTINNFIAPVDEKFPAITRNSFVSSLNNRIVRIDYEIDINGIKTIDLKQLFYEV